MSDIAPGDLDRSTPAEAPTTAPGQARGPECGHDCLTCLSVFEAAQGQVDCLRVDLAHEANENYRLWMDVRQAMERTLADLVPSRRTPGGPGFSAEFVRGWNQCVVEIEHRVRELRKVI